MSSPLGSSSQPFTCALLRYIDPLDMLALLKRTLARLRDTCRHRRHHLRPGIEDILLSIDVHLALRAAPRRALATPAISSTSLLS
mmetsp:Transcript_62965/g.205519  ORF Transcript_62965/g.205519 Transcript_62965/m.205519 type:complete len:85 (-) Transcript_62965:118-372(-)